MPTFHIDGAERIKNKDKISHLDFDNQSEAESTFIPEKEKTTILVTSGASCPDATVDEIITKILSYFPNAENTKTVMDKL